MDTPYEVILMRHMLREVQIVAADGERNSEFGVTRRHGSPA
jgi:hypothetical protein